MKLSLHSDKTLLVLVQAGNQKAFEELYHRYWEELYWSAFRRLNDEFVAESLVQEVFVDVYVKKDQIYVDNSLKPYLYRVLKNKVIDEIRKRLSEQAYRQNQLNRPPILANDVIEKLEHKEFREQLSLFTNTLPRKCREVFLLKQKEFSNKEIAAHLNISEKTVEGHVTRARRRIQMYFKSEAEALFLLSFILF